MTNDEAGQVLRRAGEHVLACVALSRAEGTDVALGLSDVEAEELALWLDDESVKVGEGETSTWAVRLAQSLVRRSGCVD